MKLDAERVLIDAIVEHQPGKVFALFSGGNDSSVLTSWARITIGRRLDAAVFIDTGTALPGVREFVEAFCANRYLPLIVLDAGDAYQRMVNRWGVPGPGAHRYPYVWLKERQLDALVREHKQHHRDRIMLLTGVRRAESTRRMGTVESVKRDGCTVWVAPLIDWTNADMRAYRDHHGLEQSDVAALIHRSGECNCGAYAAPGEREMLRSLYPDWFERVITTAECAAQDRGLHCRWGERRPDDSDVTGPLCSCPSLLELEAG
jgi:3'-phosphoadenosine 5'-phosphosulfate sulfotransferase (PAPS reductase)/FAD synthetase